MPAGFFHQPHQYTQVKLGDRVLVTGSGRKEHNKPGTVTLHISNYSQEIYGITLDGTNKEIQVCRHHFRPLTKPNRETL